MSLPECGFPHARTDAHVATRGRARRRLLVTALAVALDVAAALLLAGQGLAGAAVGVASAGLAWIITGRLAGWQPQSADEAFDAAERR
jgi:hypothetical protein